jgi:hypothetical protein
MTEPHRTAALVPMVLVLTAGMVAAAEARSSRELTMRLSDGIVLAVSMDGVDGDAPSPDIDVRSSARTGEVHRLVVDERGIARFAYAVSVEPDGEGAALSFRPVRLHETLGAFSPGTPTYTLPFGLDGAVATLDEHQTTGRVSEGDVIRLDVFEQPETGRRLTDVIRVVELSPSSVRRLAASRALSSGKPPTLTLAQFELKRDGTLVGRMGGLATNHVVMLGLVGRGTVIFSAEPHPDEPSAGMATVEGGTLRFWLDGHEYEYVSAEPVGPAGLTSLWMYVADRDVPDPSWRDRRAGPIWVGASDSVDRALAMLRWRPAAP